MTLVGLLAALGLSTARAEEGPNSPAPTAPAPHRERFEGWELVCEQITPTASDEASTGTKSPAANKLACKVSQQLAVKGTDRTVFMVAVLPTAPTGPKVMILSAPLGGYLVPGAELKVDRHAPTRVLFETCNAAGCHGGFRFEGRIAKEILSGHEMKVKLWTTKDKSVEISIVLDGLARAVAALDGSRR